ncbi:MAG: acetylglutamate kinase [Clostridiales Family XIII bacterium]|jgi:acetylglutamate kinase|nr:acetylglutamate kinase [Clostridiales Family XIII bacterium]
MQERKERVGILMEALPYIQKYTGKTIVVKYGGAAMTNDALKTSVMNDIVLLSLVGVNVVLVHGGGPEISSTLAALGKESVFIDGLRYTDAETADVVAMVLAGKVNKTLVSLIHKAKGKAIGLCGADGAMLQVKKMETSDLGFVGDIVAVDATSILMTLENGFVPVIATVGVDETGQLYNINADTAAAEIAAALKAEKLIFMTDVRGVLQDKDDENSFIPDIELWKIADLQDAGVITGGMIPKTEGCKSAIARGLKEAVIIDGRIEHSILLELFSDTGIGTLLHR